MFLYFFITLERPRKHPAIFSYIFSSLVEELRSYLRTLTAPRHLNITSDEKVTIGQKWYGKRFKKKKKNSPKNVSLASFNQVNQLSGNDCFFTRIKNTFFSRLLGVPLTVSSIAAFRVCLSGMKQPALLSLLKPV